MLKFADSNSPKDNDLHVMSTKKPRLAEAGYKNEKYPYVPIFTPQDSEN